MSEAEIQAVRSAGFILFVCFMVPIVLNGIQEIITEMMFRKPEDE